MAKKTNTVKTKAVKAKTSKTPKAVKAPKAVKTPVVETVDNPEKGATIRFRYAGL